MRFASESPRQRFRRTWPTALGLVIYVLVFVPGLYVAMMTIGYDGWGSVLGQLVLLAGVIVLHWLLLSVVNGYSPLNKGEPLSETGNLWHLTEILRLRGAV